MVTATYKVRGLIRLIMALGDVWNFKKSVHKSMMDF